MQNCKSWPQRRTTLLLLTALASASTGASELAVQVDESGGVVRWSLSEATEHATLRVAGPGGLTEEPRFSENGFELELRFADGSAFLDGVYVWEIFGSTQRVSSFVQPEGALLSEGLATGRESEDRTTGRHRMSARSQGSFLILDGKATLGSGAAREQEGPKTSEAVTNEALCIGDDCPVSPTFDTTTLLIMENNTRIKFDDTSTIAGFANNDWEIGANEADNGGANRFEVRDCGDSDEGGCSGNSVLVVEAGAPDSGLYVDAAGDLGLGTATPSLDLHLVEEDSPAVRFEQIDGPFTGHVWDIAGNETNFFVRDVTSGSTLPFRIKPGAPSNSLFISSDGQLGLGTDSPEQDLHLSGDGTQLLIEDSSGTSGSRELLRLLNDGKVRMALDNLQKGTEWTLANGGALTLSLNGSGNNELELSTSGNLTVLGNVIEGSSALRKENFEVLSPRALLAQVAKLPLKEWSYRNDSSRHFGPMAEDFHTAFGLGDSPTGISTLDTSGVALGAVQGLLAMVEEQAQELDSLWAALDKVAGNCASEPATEDL